MIEQTTVIVRIDGSLGLLPPSGLEEIHHNGSEISFGLIVADAGWARLADAEIRDIPLRGISGALETWVT